MIYCAGVEVGLNLTSIAWWRSQRIPSYGYDLGPHKIAAVHYHCLMNAYLTGFGWCCAEENNFHIIFSMYLNGEKIVDQHIIEIAGLEAVEVPAWVMNHTNAKCFWVEFSNFGLKPVKIQQGDQFHLLGTINT